MIRTKTASLKCAVFYFMEGVSNIEMTESIWQIYTMIASVDPQNAAEGIGKFLSLFESNLKKYHQVMAIEILSVFRENQSIEFHDRFKDVYQEFGGTNFIVGKLSPEGMDRLCQRYVEEMWKCRKEFLNAVQKGNKRN